MADPFIGEIKIFAGNFAPRGYAFCNGQLLPIAQNTALFSILGTTYGGDGRTTVGLPNLQGRMAVHPGRGPGLTPLRLGQVGGEATETITMGQMTTHAHTLQASGADTDEEGESSPAGNYTGTTPNTVALYGGTTDQVAMSAAALPSVGGGQAHENRQPYLGINYIIALVGTYPSRG